MLCQHKLFSLSLSLIGYCKTICPVTEFNIVESFKGYFFTDNRYVIIIGDVCSQ